MKTNIDKTMKTMGFVFVGGLWHMYPAYGRYTLCKVSKVHQPTAWTLQPPVCPECAASLIEASIEKAAA